MVHSATLISSHMKHIKQTADVVPVRVDSPSAGPWWVSDTSIISDKYCIAVIESDGGYEAPHEERQANIRLLASAPALLALIKKAIDADDLGPREWEAWNDESKALVAVVEGGK